MISYLYILDENGCPIPEPNILKWGEWFEGAHAIVARYQAGDSMVATDFLGIDHSHSAGGTPILWETMVFGGPMGGHTTRCAGNREQAEAMHQEVVDLVNAVLASQ